MPPSTLDQITTILAANTGVSPAGIDPGTELLTGGLSLDSIQLLDTVLDIESHLGVRLRDEDLTEDHLATVAALAAAVDARRA